jgi:hypothetical protein
MSIAGRRGLSCEVVRFDIPAIGPGGAESTSYKFFENCKKKEKHIIEYSQLKLI